MSSPSDSHPPGQPRFERDLIEKEIDHLKKRKSVRHAQETQRGWSKILIVTVIFGFLWLYFMDVFLFSYNRGDAIRVYLYLHNYGDDQKAKAVADSGLLTPYEVAQLNRRQGSFQDYFNGTGPAEQKANDLIAYMGQVHALHEHHYDSLSLVNKLRYGLFMETGLIPPTHWDGLNSSIDK
jgi:hypothetical protein